MKRRRTSVTFEGGTDDVDAPPKDGKKEDEESEFSIGGDENT